MAGKLYVGTSGWHYASWIGPFYPPRHPRPKMLAFYAERFAAAEINLSHYRAPTPAALANWRETTPAGFIFAWKAHRVITHYRRLLNTAENMAQLFELWSALGDKAGPILFQLPPKFAANRDRLAGFLAEVPRDRRYVFEFRHPSWYEEPCLAVLRDFDVALCISDHAHAPAPWLRTASFAYIRGHGPSGRYHGPSGRYHGRYADERLSRWADRAAAWRAEGADVYAFFDNDVEAAAPVDAARFQALADRS